MPITSLTNNDITDLPTIESDRYENIFHVFSTTKEDSTFYFYNILNKVVIPDDLDPIVFDYTRINKQYPWTTISYLIYGTINLWWLILITNKISNPIQMPDTGTVLKIIKPQYVDTILQNIKQQI